MRSGRGETIYDKTPNGAILVLNAGSSSLKFTLFVVGRSRLGGTAIDSKFSGRVSGIGTKAVFTSKTSSGTKDSHEWTESQPSRQEILEFVLGRLEPSLADKPLIAAVHRVVHGGTKFSGPMVVTPRVMDELESLVSLAPLHQPHNLAPIKALAQSHPGLVQIACFDTAFHSTVSPVEYTFALPSEITEQGVRRYGFHGLSYEFVVSELFKNVDPDKTRRVVVCHLGSGASMCAVKNGVSVASTMGFTALDGLPMGTRCGSLDAGVVLHLAHQGKSPKEIQDILYNRSGLLGMSGVSNDVRDLMESEKPEAAFALDVFIHRIVREVGSLAAVLRGLDALVFTAGIGERSAFVRAEVCRRLAWMGVSIDESANEKEKFSLHLPGSIVGVYRIPTNEELAMARHAVSLLASGT